MSEIVVNNTAELSQILKQASGGETILLAPGEYDSLFIKDLDFDPAITITSQDPANPATFTDPVTFVRVDGLVLDNVAFHSDSIDDTSPLLFFNGCENVSMSNLAFTGYIPAEGEGADPDAADTTRSDVIEGYGFQRGLRIHDSENVTISDSTFEDLKLAAYIGESSDVLLTGLTIEAVREGINFYETTGLTISDSLFQNFTPWLGMDDARYDTTIHDHPDMIQYWGANSTTGVHDITITGNTFLAEAGSSTQTIFGHLDGAAEGVTATNFTVTGNLIINGQIHGISLGDVDGALIADNILMPNTTDPESANRLPTIRAPDGVNIVIKDNTVVDSYGIFNSSEEATAADNLAFDGNVILSSDAESGSYWRESGLSVLYSQVLSATLQGLETVDAPETGGTIRADMAGGFVIGSANNDVLIARHGMDILFGGDGADIFQYSVAVAEGTLPDLILDLDFSEGDKLLLSAADVGYFTPYSDLSEDALVLQDGAALRILSLDGLLALVEAGALSYESDGMGGGLLSLADDSGPTMQIAGISPSDLTGEVPAAPVESLPESPGSVEASRPSADDDTRETFDPADYGMTSVVTGTDEGETLWASSGGSFIDAGAGDDILSGRNGHDVFVGGAGADRFIFDLRPSSAEDDLVLDLDFSEGDEILIVTDIEELFTNDTDPDNDLWIGGNGSSAKIRSIADLQEILDSGAMTYVNDGTGGGYLSLADGTGHSFQIAGFELI
ncbi:right-handed parallel beta-helix repeat-containing protein [Mangrovicoccus algicola]|uniref:Right-handed parallel beta-helix repeat-containing protein n=1 Tax=Mangrovicoccus algicola TaxID=2771008 RepID=A0A8J6ZB36_9RHOB|nr:right-handed parallel beta-helix repeat-containing protein [Mangrovicoccus algicola]MBE3639506.1 right-handed parallel beta-helix repeat-containing protein [Mangrovicoccus algicola]